MPKNLAEQNPKSPDYRPWVGGIEFSHEDKREVGKEVEFGLLEGKGVRRLKGVYRCEDSFENEENTGEDILQSDKRISFQVFQGEDEVYSLGLVRGDEGEELVEVGYNGDLVKFEVRGREVIRIKFAEDKRRHLLPVGYAWGKLKKDTLLKVNILRDTLAAKDLGRQGTIGNGLAESLFSQIRLLLGDFYDEVEFETRQLINDSLDSRG